MKTIYITVVFIIILILSIVNFNQVNNIRSSLVREKNNLIFLESSLFDSFVKETNRYEDIVIELTTEDTIDVLSFTETYVVLYFTKSDCRSCVEQNITDFAQFAKKNKFEEILILSDWENKEYIQSISNMFPDLKHKFGIVLTKPLAFENCLFLIRPNGNISNQLFLKSIDYNIKQRFLNHIQKNVF